MRIDAVLPLLAVCLAVTLLCSAAAFAEAPDAAAPAEENAPTSTAPTGGMSMEQVEQLFGQPKQRLAPVGKPPITRWVYDGYTVYFENRRVIHTVINRK